MMFGFDLSSILSVLPSLLGLAGLDSKISTTSPAPLPDHGSMRETLQNEALKTQIQGVGDRLSAMLDAGYFDRPEAQRAAMERPQSQHVSLGGVSERLLAPKYGSPYISGVVQPFTPNSNSALYGGLFGGSFPYGGLNGIF